MANNIKELFEGHNLSEDFVKEVETLFEARLAEKVNELEENQSTIEEELQNKYEALSEQYVEEVVLEELSEKLEKYVDYVVESWMKDNAIAIETGVKVEMAESLLSGMKNLFTENYIEVPAEKQDILEDLENRLLDTNEKISSLIEENVELKNSLKESKTSAIFKEETSGLTDTQVERLSTLSESINFVDEQDYRDRLNILKKSFLISESTQKNEDSVILSESAEEEIYIDENISRYVNSIKRFNK